MTAPPWWQKPRRISVLVDNPSWILPHAETLVAELNAKGDQAALVRVPDSVPRGLCCFMLGCVRRVPEEICRRNRYNLVVHESDLPHGRGFAPLTWQILEGGREIPIVLIEAAAEVDAGPVYLRDVLTFSGHELNPELREAQGAATRALCHRFLDSPTPPEPRPQQGRPTMYRRRTPNDSELDPDRSLRDQFNLLRTVDNDRYPAFFRLDGQVYRLRIDKIATDNTGNSRE